MLAALSALAVLFFVAVTGISHVYRAQQESLGKRWFTRGSSEFNAGHYGGAVSDFRAALLYSRDDYSYQFSLAEALVGLRRTNEARAYLINLWERKPEDGFVNRELARIYAQSGDTDKALRYYHNAIYATWPDDQESERRQTHLELIHFLLKANANAQARSELIELEANLGNRASERAQVGSLFVQAKDYENALGAFQMALESDRHNTDAMRGAGLSAFELGRYVLAERYLKGAIVANPRDTESATRLKTTQLVLQMDPFRQGLSGARKNQIVVDAFAAAGQRLKSCRMQSTSFTAPVTGPTLDDSWQRMKPKITAWRLQHHPELVEMAMNLVFQIERETVSSCEMPSGTDAALLLIAKSHEGS